MEEHATSRSISPAPDDARLTSLLTATFAEQAERATPAPDALVRLNVRLDAGVSARPWWAGHLRLAGAVAAALIVLVLVTPIGRLAAAGIHNAAQAVVTTITNVKDLATGDGGSDNSSPTPNPPGTPAPPGAVNGSAVATVPTSGGTRTPGTTTTGSAVTGTTATGTTTTGSAVTGSSVTGSATRTGTNAPGSATGTASGTIVPGTPTSTVGATAAATNIPAPPASTTAPTAAPSRVPGATAPAVTLVTATPTIPPAPPTATAPRPPTATSTSATGSTPVSAAVVPDAYAKERSRPLRRKVRRISQQTMSASLVADHKTIDGLVWRRFLLIVARAGRLLIWSCPYRCFRYMFVFVL